VLFSTVIARALYGYLGAPSVLVRVSVAPAVCLRTIRWALRYIRAQLTINIIMYHRLAAPEARTSKATTA
jgi:hypothetical protein